MKVLIVSDSQSVHTQRWVTSLHMKGVEVVLYTIVPIGVEYYTQKGIKCHVFDLFNYKREKKGPLYPIRRHFEAVKDLKRVIREEHPDILHSHYVTSYSLIAALSGFHPHVESVWGSDVYIYPKKSLLHKMLVKYTLNKADKILSTSHIMAEETRKYTNMEIEITPFGVDTALFCRKGPQPQGEFVIGSVKSLAPNYGNEYIIRAFHLITINNPTLDCSLELAGKGPDKEKLERLASELGISGKVKFRGFIPNHELPEFFQRCSMALYMSNSESFGVSAIEAMACECPVVTSDADGFKEVMEEGKTGFIVPKRDYRSAAEAIQKIIDDPQLAAKMGKAGRERVCNKYNWEDNVNAMIQIYNCICREK